MRVTARYLSLLAAALLAACGGAPQPAAHFDLIVRGGTVYDGGGGTPYRADLGIRGDTIAAIGDLAGATAATSIDATGLAVAPGFVNMMCWVHVLVNGVQVLAGGEHTGATPGRVVRGPGWSG
jgi:N-acyl-D-aspartate/D-glutamate deacylase